MKTTHSVCATFLRESPIRFGEGTSTDGTSRIGRAVSEDKLSEKEPWSEWCRRLKHRSGSVVGNSFQPHPSPTSIKSDSAVCPEQGMSALSELPNLGACSCELNRSIHCEQGLMLRWALSVRCVVRLRRRRFLESRGSRILWLQLLVDQANPFCTEDSPGGTADGDKHRRTGCAGR